MAIDAATASIVKDKAEALFDKGRFSEAFDAYEKIKPYGDKDPRVYLRMGDIARKLGDNAAALSCYKDAVRSFTKLGFVIKAIAVCKIIIAIDPGQQGIHDKLAELYAGQGAVAPPKATVVIASPVAAPEPAAAPAQELPKVSKATDKAEDDDDIEVIQPMKLPRVPLFSDFNEEEFLAVIRKVRSHDFAPGEYVFREGDAGDSIFIIAEGAAKVIGRAKDGNEVSLATLTEGAIFGEFGFFSNAKRTTDIKAVDSSTILELTKTDLDEIIKKHKRVEEVLFKFYKERVVDRLMGLSDIFRPIAKPDRAEILSRLQLTRFLKGSVIVREGEKGDIMYLIKTGAVSVWTADKGGKAHNLSELREGDFFGEIALATSRPRVANITAIENTELVAFSRPLIKDILMKYPAVKEVLERVIKERVIESAKAKERFSLALV
ncbi:MAG: cyclic nucleotide-binding domain-containing protein [Deltaproteobacteria bacterium]|nr:cyclic nucleotide-binding domain-containing protein [Deltaproteobacteria bacterium]